MTQFDINIMKEALQSSGYTGKLFNDLLSYLISEYISIENDIERILKISLDHNIDIAELDNSIFTTLHYFNEIKK